MPPLPAQLLSGARGCSPDLGKLITTMSSGWLWKVSTLSQVWVKALTMGMPCTMLQGCRRWVSVSAILLRIGMQRGAGRQRRASRDRDNPHSPC